jgi:hypothetical protein
VKRRPGTPDPVFQRADAPTLSLSTVQLDACRLRQLLVFERTLRSLAPQGSLPEEIARAHAAALAASGMSAGDVEAPLALLRRFAANRALRSRLGQRVGPLEARGPDDAASFAQAVELRQRMAALDEALEGREETETRRLLEAHAAEILALFAAALPHG